MGESPDIDDISVADARAMAYRYLGQREHSCKELADKLVRRGVPEDIATIAVDELADENLVSDHRFAEAYVRSRVARLNGPLKIRAELSRKGIEASLIDMALACHDEEWVQLALAWGRRRARKPFDKTERARVYRNGGSRGFTHEQMMSAIDSLRDEIAEEAF